MIYAVLIIAVLAILFLGFFSHYRTKQTVLFTGVVLSYTLAIFAFLVYLSKDAFHLNIFWQYFPIPRQLVLDYYSWDVAKLSVLSLLNFLCSVFILCNVLFAVNFVTGLSARARHVIPLCAGIYLTLQTIFFNPYVYKALYSLVYPRFLGAMQMDEIFYTASQISNVLDCAILIVCAGATLAVTFLSPKIQILRMSLLSVAISYTLVVCSYIVFFNKLPGHLIKYSKAADIVTYRPLATTANLNNYQYFPYVLLVFFLLFSASILYFSMMKRRMDSSNLEITKNIRAANVSSRLFCHYMKNEILSISAEVEDLPVTEETREPLAEILARCDAIYHKLDGIHKSMKDNTMSIRQVPIDGVVRSALEHVKNSNRLEGVEVALSCPKEIPYVMIDPVYFEQALIEILYNAGDAMLHAEKKALSVTVNYGMRWVTVEIQDTGCGISKKDMENIFTPLFSTHAMTKNWGIGLTLAHRIITALNGRIEVHSQVGRGTVFEILLPAARSPREPVQVEKGVQQIHD